MTQESFSVLWGSPEHRATETYRPYATNETAKAERDRRYRFLKQAGVKCRRSVLKSALRQYWSFGVECGEYCDVYYLNINEA